METTVETPVLKLTPSALEKVLELRSAEEDGDSLALRVEVTGSTGGDYTYDLAFEAFAEALEEDAIYREGDLPVWIPAESVEALQGATLDLPSASGQGGLVLRNPNKPNPLAGVKLELSGSTADKVRQLLDQQINPALAAHGGFATLVGVEGEKAFVTMGGGCQGCAVSAMTLRDGIETSIKANIREITEVVDTTDHDLGENPYY
jgi:Fe/S biogenesis protein NfuA